MLTRPELADRTLVAALREGWGIVLDVEYLPVGFGSHHWRGVDAPGRRWFVTVDDLAAKARDAEDSLAAVQARLRAALGTARAVADTGAGYVLAPLPRAGGEVLARIGERYAAAVYPYVDGVSPGWGGELAAADRRAVLKMIAGLHATPENVRRGAGVEDFLLPRRDALHQALGELGRPWAGGPYGERARALLADHAHTIERLLAHFDDLVAEARREPERMVLTHGEPHPGNLLRADAGWLLIDWDTALVAPPERDLWHLDPGDGSVLDAYARETGRPVRSAMVELYRLGWRLTEIALYTATFRGDHRDTEDTRLSWQGFAWYVTEG